MLFKRLVEYSNRIKKVSSRNEKVHLILDFLSNLPEQEAESGVNFISCQIRQGKLNLAWSGLSKLMTVNFNRKSRSVNLSEIDEFLEQAKKARGQQKLKVLEPLIARLTPPEREYFVSLILNAVEQGAGEGVVKTAIAKFFELPKTDIEQAYMHTPNLGKLFVHLLKQGKTAIKDLCMKIFNPVKPMLAEISESLTDIYDEYDHFAIEQKLDGLRIQVHRRASEVKIFSRHLKDITIHFPELVEVARGIATHEFILDGEAIGIDKNGSPVPFQMLAKRITRKKDITKISKKIPVVPKFFDILYVKGDDLTSGAYSERWKILNDVVRDKEHLALRQIALNKINGRRFFESAVAEGNEGVMIKLLDSPYRAGKRGKFWFKIKKVQTIDCVIIAAEWGHGRRRGWLSNLHLGVLDETKTKYLMVGKTFKGVTDKMLKWLTVDLSKIKVYEDKWTLYVKPEIVVEIAFNEAQYSSKYDSGFALRFARVKHIRKDKAPYEINTILDLTQFARRGR